MAAYESLFGGLVQYLRNADIEQFTTEDLKKYFYHLHTDSELSSSTIFATWRTIRSFYN